MKRPAVSLNRGVGRLWAGASMAGCRVPPTRARVARSTLANTPNRDVPPSNELPAAAVISSRRAARRSPSHSVSRSVRVSGSAGGDAP